MKPVKEPADMTDLFLSRLLVILLTVILPGSGVAQTTTFTYQGKLTDSGNLANGNYDMQFKLFDALSGGTQQGSTLTNPTVQTAGGIFTVNLDFGTTVFTGATRYLEIAVRPAGSANPYMVLAPRQQITSSPYAIQTVNAQQLGGLPASRYVNADAGGNVGIGTTSPASKLSVFTPINSYGFTHTDGVVTLGSYIGTGTGWFGTRSNHSLNFFTNDSAPRMTIDTVGNVSIGSLGATAAARLYLDGGPGWTSSFWHHALAFSNVSAIGWTPNAAGQRFGIGQSSGGLYFFRTTAPFGTTTDPPNYDLMISDSANIGIGTTNPTAKLSVSTLAANLANNTAYFEAPNIGPNASNIHYGTTGDWYIRSASSLGKVILQDTGGNVGIGTATPNARLTVAGDVTQNRDKGDFVKAMAYVLSNGNILRCYNGITGSSSGNCGFLVNHFANGGYGVDFGFQVNDRFVSVSAEWSTITGGSNAGANFRITGTNTVDVRTFLTDSTFGTSDANFILIVY
jgi:hypothetical protein